MDIWMSKFLAELDRLGIPIHLITKYVDDILVVTSKCQRGVRYKEGELVYTQEAEQEDAQKSQEKCTMELLTSIANSFYGFLQFTHEVSENGASIPVLHATQTVHQGIQWPLVCPRESQQRSSSPRSHP